MIIFVILLVLIMFSGLRTAPLGGYLTDYMDKRQNNYIKGIFILLIVLSHYAQYLPLEGPLDLAYGAMQAHLNQGVVALFFFYSGYGMMESIKRKGFGYVKGIPTQRFLKVWFNFAVAVVVFLIVGLAFGKRWPLFNIVFAFIGWSNVGNSSWYMFAIFSLYLLTWLAFLELGVVKNEKAGWYLGTFLLSVLTVLAVGWQIWMDRPMYAYDTMILFPAGFWYSLWREGIEKIIWRNGVIFSGFCAFVALVYVYSYIHRWEHTAMTFSVWILAFTVAVVLLTMKVHFESPILEWFGQNLFWVYILQRLPMNLFFWTGVMERHKYFCLVLSLVITVFLTMLFDRYVGALSGRLFGKRKEARS